MSFKVGDKVVCIKSFSGYSITGERVKNRLPIVGNFYTIDGFCNEGYLYLLEINEIAVWGMALFNPQKFRKVDESFAEGVLENILKNTDLEELKELEEEISVNK